jgi:dipeptidase E
MKLYLSSYRLGNRTAELEQMVVGRKRMGVVRNALDFSTDKARLNEGREREFDALRQVGLHPDEIDLRDYFGSPANLRKVVEQYDGLWVVGGNSFVLRRAIQQSGLDNILLERVGDRQFVYAGYSAGVCVVTPTLKGIHLVDPPEVLPEGYNSGVVWDGLGLVPFSIAPHYRSDHPESPMIETVVTFFIGNRMPFIALRDGEVHIEDIRKLNSASNRIGNPS